MALYFDVTDIVERAMHNTTVSGIQRSTIKIIERLVRKDERSEIRGFIKHPLSEKFQMADLSFMRGNYGLSDFADRFIATPSGKELWMSGKLLKYRGRPLKRAFGRCRLHIKWATSEKIRARFPDRIVEKPCGLRDLSLRAGDTLIALGAGWGLDYRGTHALAQKHGCQVASFVHDIIPIMLPEMTVFGSKDRNDKFKRWLDFISQESALILCNSRFTESELRNYMKGQIPPTIVVDFPHEFSLAVGEPVRDEVSELANDRYVLCVGTIEIRKNILGLLKAWKALSARPEKLILAGAHGWMNEDLYAFLDESNYVDGSVIIIGRPNDTELACLYRNCVFTVFPSFYEGWGLPIGESLWFGKPVICAGNASMPEVGKQFARYFDHKKPGDLQRALEEMIAAPQFLPGDIRSYLTTWDATARSTLRAVRLLHTQAVAA